MRLRLLTLALAAFTLPGIAQGQPSQTDAFDGQVTREGVTLSYQDPTGALSAPVRKRIIDTFYFAYLRERADFHPKAPADVRIVIDPAYNGVAYVGDKDKATTITINPGWLLQHPDDIDLVTHEAMHIVQGYPSYGDKRVPGWLVEGIADYARDRYGMGNAAAGWALPQKVGKGQTVESGYRVTGAFLKWAEGEHPGLVLTLDKALRAGQYTPALWQKHAGKALPALWAEYAKPRSDAPPPAPARRGKR
ncbi:MAG TPA: Basic Secretory protein [Stenotrophomonas sp.]|uniref:basic secretory protein-like protein n=1 Tax=unclassified Stenotrophomonas TaxID=196198 RepID=UPI000DE6FE16|nr:MULTISPECIES: basic secretory protein-like protein [unclassified Stenotrophomonas]PWB25598.1 Basic Secretory protein [Stenotrophomonas sp. SPM]HCR34520.1 Basic Secretory protein [Stenotrophomonas sp.]